MKYKFAFILSFCFVQYSNAQRTAIYEGKAIHIPAEGAVEKFRHVRFDTLMQPIGTLQWRLVEELADGMQNISLISASYDKGKLNGEFIYTNYHVKYAVDSLSHDRLSSTARGIKKQLKGRFEQGRTQGIWEYTTSDYPNTNAVSAKLTYDARERIWEGREGIRSFKGRTDREGYFMGDWHWDTEAELSPKLTYDNGILIKVSGVDSAISNHPVFDFLDLALRSGDSVAVGNWSPSFTWNLGLAETDTLISFQKEHIAHQLDGLLAHYRDAFELFRQTGINVPLIKGTKRFYYPLDPADSVKLTDLKSNMLAMDSVINSLIQQPVFELRKNSNEVLSELISKAESSLTQLAYLNAKTDYFLSEEARVVIAALLPQIDGERYHTHRLYAKALQVQSAQRMYFLERIKSRLLEKRDKLREESAITDLEEEWTRKLKFIEQEYMPDSLSAIGLKIFDQYVMQDFVRRSRKYASLTALAEQRAFLMEAVEYTDWYHHFFKTKQYLFLEEAPEKFTEAYTRMLYNPFTGQYDVKEVLKRRFLANVQTSLWPWVIDNTLNAPTEGEFREWIRKSREIKKAIQAFATMEQKEAKRIERRLRREKDMSEMTEILLEFVAANSPVD